ncbi:unnamed protein product [Haemonchus placei]|uniref:Ubiquitin-like domain-containing protein n=1 Tax=Haemonchus placei TaxID=6290 RepID=A0A0N4WY84_HAEPC|nr:unnamed protein product [Haemonchus placei]
MHYNQNCAIFFSRFALGETARPMLIRPVDVKWSIYCTSIYCYLYDGITTRSIDESEMVGDFMALQVQFSLPSGCYATVALRQITGTDMGKNSMKIHAEAAKTDWSNAQNSEHSIMKVSVKNRANGTVFQVELDANATIGELRSKIVSHVGDS